jgi:hypothetical protein
MKNKYMPVDTSLTVERGKERERRRDGGDYFD